MPKPEILDPQGKAVTGALARLGFAGISVRQGKRFELELDGEITEERLAEVRLAQGRSAEARALLDEALLLARWSSMGMHLLQRIFGTLIASAPDPKSARIMVDRAESTLGEPDQCWFCTVMLADPADPELLLGSGSDTLEVTDGVFARVVPSVIVALNVA